MIMPHGAEAIYQTLPVYSGSEGIISMRLRRRLIAVGTVVVTCALPSCTDSAAQEQPGRNAPAASRYFLDAGTAYYDDLTASLEYISDPIARSNVERLLETPMAYWLTRPAAETRTEMQAILDESQHNNATPVFVAYNLPIRDLGGESAGGLEGADEYRNWIKTISETIGDSPAVIVLEPDALPAVTQMGEVQGNERIAMLRSALEILASNSNTAVYLDAGNSTWLSPGEMANLIERVDPEDNVVTGLAINTANQRPTPETRDYGDQISAALGRELFFLIDTSMNGAEITVQLTEWCNPEGEKIGNPNDILFIPDDRYEEFITKYPGQSDGVCGTSDAKAGEFDGELLLRQVS